MPRRRGGRPKKLPPRVQDLRNGPSATSTETETHTSLSKRGGRPSKDAASSPAKATGKRKADGEGGDGKPAKSAKRSAAMQLWWNKRKGLVTTAQPGAVGAEAGTREGSRAATPASQQSGVSGRANGKKENGTSSAPTKAVSTASIPAPTPRYSTTPIPLPESPDTLKAREKEEKPEAAIERLTEFERFQKLSNGEPPDAMGRKRRRTAKAGGDRASGEGRARRQRPGLGPRLAALDGTAADMPDGDEEGTESEDDSEEGDDGEAYEE